jgi:hypothetical protein
MALPLLPQPSLCRVSVLLAAVVVALSVAVKASAGCGDHVVVLKPAGEAGATEPLSDSPTPKPPCHGPHCSAGPVKPTPAPPSTGAVSAPSAKEQFTPVGASDTDCRRVLRRLTESGSPRPIDRPSSIFHPPRA